MAGYYGFSMSNNAVTAYEDGKRPLSKWTKTAILDRACSKMQDEGAEPDQIAAVMTALKSLSIKTLKARALTVSEWHHCSSWYNRTDFYDVVDTLDLIENASTWTEQNEQEQEQIEHKVRARFLEWTGSRAHPKATEHEEYGTIRGKWFYREDGSRKSVTARGFAIVSESN